jgi:hypothetical protein
MTYQFSGDETEQAEVGMAKRMKSEAPGSHEDGGPEAMIELNEMDDSVIDDDVIELTDVFSIPEDEQNGIIELTEKAAEEEVSDTPESLTPIEVDPSAGEDAAQDAGQEILELADQATAPGGSFESQYQQPHPKGSLLSQTHYEAAEAGGFSASGENAASAEDELLDFGDLDLGSADLDADSAPGLEADDAPEEALFLDDQDLVDFADHTQGAVGGFAAEEYAAAAQTGGETQGLLDLEGLSTPPGEGALEDDEFSDIFSDPASGANAAAEPAEMPSTDGESQGRGDVGPEIAAPASQAAELPPAGAGQAAVKTPQSPEPLEAGNEEEKFILGAGGIRMREKASGSLHQATSIPAQAAVAAVRNSAAAGDPVVSAEQVEAAVERVVRRMFSDRIEAMLMEVLEKAVSEEIQRVKKALLAGSPENDTR